MYMKVFLCTNVKWKIGADYEFYYLVNPVRL